MFSIILTAVLSQGRTDLDLLVSVFNFAAKHMQANKQSKKVIIKRSYKYISSIQRILTVLKFVLPSVHIYILCVCVC